MPAVGSPPPVEPVEESVVSQVKMSAESRTEFGKGAARRLRRDGRVPAVIYGGDTEVIHLSLDAHDLMMALKQPKVVLEIALADSPAQMVAPRDVQRDPIRSTFEHVDLVVLSRREVRERLVLGQAMAKAEQVAIEEELDPVAVATAVSEILSDEDNELEADDAIAAALEQVREAMKAQAEAAAAAAAAEDAAADSAAEADESADEGAADSEE